MLCSCYHPLYVYIEYTCQPKVNNRANIKKKHPTVITAMRRQKGVLGPFCLSMAHQAYSKIHLYLIET